MNSTEGVLDAHMPQFTDGETEAPVTGDPSRGPLPMPSSYATASPVDLGNAWPDSDDEECVLHFDDAATLAKYYNCAVGVNPSYSVPNHLRTDELNSDHSQFASIMNAVERGAPASLIHVVVRLGRTTGVFRAYMTLP